jgi:hypothetical protein
MKENRLGQFNHINSLNIFLLTLIIYSLSTLAGTSIQSGVYRGETATIGYDGTYMTGCIDEQVGEDGRFVCHFSFSGKVSGETFPVVCRNSVDTNATKGNISIVDSARLFLKTEENPGCSNMIASFEGRGDTLSLDGYRKILQVRIVQNDKAFFYSTPDYAGKRKAYLVKGDEAIVDEIANGWLKVTYGKTTGWINERDMVPLF